MSEWTNAGVPNIGVDKCRMGQTSEWSNIKVDKRWSGKHWSGHCLNKT